MNLKVWIFLLLCSMSACSGDSGKGVPNGERVSFAGVVEKSQFAEGLFDIYRDKESGETCFFDPDNSNEKWWAR